MTTLYNASLPVPRAYAALLETTKGALSTAKARQFALTWLAAARMVTLRTVSTLPSLDELSSLSAWKTLQAAGLPIEDLLSMFDKQSGGLPAPERPLEIVYTLYKELGSALWDVVPTLGAVSRFGAKEHEPNEAVAPVAELMLDLVGSPDGEDLWLPFDFHGLLTIRALRRGWRVNAAQMMDVGEPVALKLLLAIEHGRPSHSHVHSAVSRDPQGRPTTTARHVMAVPPIRVLVRHSLLAQWDSTGSNSAEQFDRSETMAVHELLHRVTGRAVFLVPAGVLFTSGRDQRLREDILHRGGECDDLDSVIALPAGAYSSTNIASAILVVGRSQHVGTRLVDLGIAKRGKTDVEQTIRAGRDLALGLITDTTRSCVVARDEFRGNDYVLSPSRYLTKKVTVGPNAVALGQLCELIRPPAPVKGETGEEAVEVGIPELSTGSWADIIQLLDKRVLVRSTRKDTTSLKAGDILLSVKGTVGKAGLLGRVNLPKLVASQSCIALRVKEDGSMPDAVSPAYLLMYLRSEQAQAQLDALKVGSGMQHVSIATLMESFKVPVPPRSDQKLVLDDYRQLCSLEAEIAQLAARVESLVKSRWTGA